LISSDLCVPKNIEETYKRLLVKAQKGICKRENSDNDKLIDSNVAANPNFFYESENSFASNIAIEKSEIFYKVMSFFVSENMSKSILLMRVFNSFLFSLLVIAIFFTAPKTIIFPFLASLLLTSIPYGFPLITSINTSSWAIIGCATSWPFLYTLLAIRPLSLSRKVLLGFLALGSSLLSIAGRHESFIFILAMNLSIWGTTLYQHNKPAYKNFWRKLLPCFFLVVLTIVLYEKSQGFVRVHIVTAVKNWRYQFFSIMEPNNIFLDLGASIKRTLLLVPRILGLENPHWQPPGAPKIVFWINFLMLLSLLKVFIGKSDKVQKLFISVSITFIFLVVAFHTFTSPQTINFYYFRTNIFGDELHSRYLMPLIPFVFGFVLALSRDLQIALHKERLQNSLIVATTFVNSISLISAGQIFRENSLWFWKMAPLTINIVSLCGSISFFVFVLAIFSNKLVNVDEVSTVQ
jgi:hypothetical protein